MIASPTAMAVRARTIKVRPLATCGSHFRVAKMFCTFYTYAMASRSKSKSVATFSLKLGNWLEATATGWGIVAVPIVILLIGCAAALRYALE